MGDCKVLQELDLQDWEYWWIADGIEHALALGEVGEYMYMYICSLMPQLTSCCDLHTFLIEFGPKIKD